MCQNGKYQSDYQSIPKPNCTCVPMSLWRFCFVEWQEGKDMVAKWYYSVSDINFLLENLRGLSHWTTWWLVRWEHWAIQINSWKARARCKHKHGCSHQECVAILEILWSYRWQPLQKGKSAKYKCKKWYEE